MIIIIITLLLLFTVAILPVFNFFNQDKAWQNLHYLYKQIDLYTSLHSRSGTKKYLDKYLQP